MRNRVHLYLSLIRFHAPTGTLLLAFPTLWTITILTESGFHPFLLFVFLLGAFLMRSAGCIINDMTDQKLDAQIARTQHRPLASGRVSMREACALLALLLILAAMVALSLGLNVFVASFVALPLIIAYPWMKRITFWPQLFLGITFNYGVILASIAMIGSVHPSAVLIYLGSVLWTLGYDTIYGFQDIIDDEKTGIRSTARLFGDKVKPSLAAIYGMTVGLWTLALWLADANAIAYIAIVIVVLHFTWQIRTLDIYSPTMCSSLFKSNAWLGGAILIALLIAN